MSERLTEANLLEEKMQFASYLRCERLIAEVRAAWKERDAALAEAAAMREFLQEFVIDGPCHCDDPIALAGRKCCTCCEAKELLSTAGRELLEEVRRLRACQADAGDRFMAVVHQRDKAEAELLLLRGREKERQDSVMAELEWKLD